MRSGSRSLCGECEDHPVWQGHRLEIVNNGRLLRAALSDEGPAARLFRLAKNRGNRRALDHLMDRCDLSALLPAGSRLLVPVPPSKRRLIQRDLSVPDLFAFRLSSLSGIPVTFSGIARTSDDPQKSRNRTDRRSMVDSPHFSVESGVTAAWPGDGIILVDDLLVTGSTLQSVENLLLREGLTVRAQVALLARRRESVNQNN